MYTYCLYILLKMYCLCPYVNFSSPEENPINLYYVKLCKFAQYYIVQIVVEFPLIQREY